MATKYQPDALSKIVYQIRIITKDGTELKNKSDLREYCRSHKIENVDPNGINFCVAPILRENNLQKKNKGRSKKDLFQKQNRLKECFVFLTALTCEQVTSLTSGQDKTGCKTDKEGPTLLSLIHI